MPSAAKAKGTAYESAIVRGLAAFLDGRFGLAPRRPAQAGRYDTGDIHGLSPWVAQCKDWRSWEAAIREGLDGAEKQRVHARERYGVAFVKRSRRALAEGYAVTTVGTWARVLVRMARAESLLREHAPDAYAAHLVDVDADDARPIPSYGARGADIA